MLRLEHVSKTFETRKDDVHAVVDVSLKVQKGEIYGLIGFSGAGKSTLIRLINLLEKPTSGEVIVDNVNLTKLNEKQLREQRKKIGMIFQHFNLMRSRTVFNNIAYPLSGSGLSKSEIKDKVTKLLKLVELEDKADAYPSQLSGGQKQRVAIARALANDPKLLLCDEATSALDPQTTRSILHLLKQVNRQLGITIVLITHEMGVIKEICDRVGIMEDGQIKESGQVVDIFYEPKEEITKNFISTAQNLDKIVELIEDDSEITRLKPGGKIALLSYNTINTNDALISKISRDFNVDANIIFGNIEVFQNKPLGRLVVIFNGQTKDIEQSIDFLKKSDVKVEVIKSC